MVLQVAEQQRQPFNTVLLFLAYAYNTDGIFKSQGYFSRDISGRFICIFRMSRHFTVFAVGAIEQTLNVTRDRPFFEKGSFSRKANWQQRSNVLLVRSFGN